MTDMSPQIYQKHIQETLQNLLVNNHTIENDIKYIVKAVKEEALGFKIDTWGNIENPKDYLFFDQIMKDNAPILNKMKREIRKNINAQLKTTNVKLVKTQVNRMLEKVMHDIIGEELILIQEDIKLIAKEQIQEQLKPWFALRELMTAAKIETKENEQT